jgi:hypothetical protein
MRAGFWLGDFKEGVHLLDFGIDGKVVLKWIFRKWINLAQDRDKWQVLVSMVVNLQVP